MTHKNQPSVVCLQGSGDLTSDLSELGLSVAGKSKSFIVAGYKEHPPIEFMADARPVREFSSESKKGGQKAVFPTLLAGIGSININGSGLVVEANGRDKMVDRWRMSEDHGLLRGMDETSLAETRAAGNAVVPQVVEWIAQKLIKTF